MSSLKYWIWLSSLKGFGAGGARKALSHFETPEKIFFSSDEEIDAAPFTAFEKSALKEKSLRKAYEVIEKCDELGVRILTLGDAEYPSRLKNIFDPPPVLYVKGKLPVIDDEPAIAMVGTRKCTPYGLKTGERIAYEAAKRGAVIVTGLAEGVDSAAAKGALRAGGRVIGVLGCGIDIVYPKKNERLFADVCTEGALITEFAPGTEPSGRNFPIRNRIMSGISLGTVVIEAPEKSGALITASIALEQGKDVFAVPGNVDAYNSAGTNALIKEGAIPVTGGDDIMREYVGLFPDKIDDSYRVSYVPLDASSEKKLIKDEQPKEEKEKGKKSDSGEIIPVKRIKKSIDKKADITYIDLKTRPDGVSDDEYAVLKILDEQLQADEIVEKTGLSPAKVLAALTMLEIKGYVLQNPGKRFSRRIMPK